METKKLLEILRNGEAYSSDTVWDAASEAADLIERLSRQMPFKLVNVYGDGDAVLTGTVENRDGKPFLVVWADINSEDPTHEIDLSEAAESLRKADEVD